jgi:hypothetical protein
LAQAQTTSRVFLVRPASFGFNAETAQTNAFQNAPAAIEGLQEKVLHEFDSAVQKLRGAGIDVIAFGDTALPPKPDAVFPNNWLSLHADGTLVLYPMCTANRRTERRADILSDLEKRFLIKRTIDLSPNENQGRFLE